MRDTPSGSSGAWGISGTSGASGTSGRSRWWWAGWIATATLYPAVLAVVCAVAAGRPAAVRDAWAAWLSTNLVNLRDHPVAALAGSAFIVESDAVVWVVLAIVGLGATGWVLGFRRTTALVAVAHLIGTAVSEGILAVVIRRGDRPATDRLLLDVGPSYVVVCALTAGLAYGRLPGRIVAGLGLAALAPYLFDGLTRLEVAPVGHVCAVVIGVLGGRPVAGVLGGRPGRTSPRP